MKTSLFDSELNSESNGDIFIDGQMIGKKFSLIFVCLYDKNTVYHIGKLLTLHRLV